jgi:hypothetical protein
MATSLLSFLMSNLFLKYIFPKYIREFKCIMQALFSNSHVVQSIDSQSSISSSILHAILMEFKAMIAIKRTQAQGKKSRGITQNSHF